MQWLGGGNPLLKRILVVPSSLDKTGWMQILAILLLFYYNNYYLQILAMFNPLNTILSSPGKSIQCAAIEISFESLLVE